MKNEARIVEFSEPGWEEADEFDKAEKNTAEEIIIERERQREEFPLSYKPKTGILVLHGHTKLCAREKLEEGRDMNEYTCVLPFPDVPRLRET
ncbi:hypothetical protein C4D60_Mb01t10660 [Musa balbisiana]|uniref:Uncharacterized protein n=1 Tax=Musa balbisiana TaxID=52838 RepID=A0A4S8JLJ6_MUSBA|nr:hypothetical protein C4D60_Mb01t10660 [Musa balbisiana]